MPDSYVFTTAWKVQAPKEKVWHAILESTCWPQWWLCVLSVHEINPGDENGIGSIRKYTFDSRLGYRLTFCLELTERVEYHYLHGTVSGQLKGTGSWTFREEHGITSAICHWHVAPKVSWMRHFGFVLAPLFRYSHAQVMKKGLKGLRIIVAD